MLGGTEAYPKFSLTEPLYNMNTFVGRACYFISAVDPRRMTHRPSTIEDAKQKLRNYSVGDRSQSDEALWEARGVVEACVHPKTGETIFPLFRMAAFVPVNFAIVPIMLMPSTISSVARTIGIHWVNQSYNCAVNYANRASDALPLSELMPAYAGAVGVSVSLALGATFALRRLPQNSPSATLVRATLPFFAVSASGSANVAITRQREWRLDGVEIKDDKGTVVGRSTAAAWHGLTLCAAARIIWNIPCMMLPVLISGPIMNRFPSIFNTKYRRIGLEVLICNFGTAFGVPPALAVFPPVVSFPVSGLEPAVRERLAKERPDLKEVRFYKGL
jgi:tricarboxylate carrier